MCDLLPTLEYDIYVFFPKSHDSVSHENVNKVLASVLKFFLDECYVVLLTTTILPNHVDLFISSGWKYLVTTLITIKSGFRVAVPENMQAFNVVRISVQQCVA